MHELNMTLVRNIENKIDDCSSASQLRKVFNIYKVYLYNEQIKEKFDSKIEQLKLINDKDEFTQNVLDKFIEDYEDEIDDRRKCTNGPLKNSAGRRSHEPLEARSDLTINIQVSSKEGSVYKDAIYELIRMALYKSMGNKNEAARILGVSNKKLNKVVDNNGPLKQYLKEVRKEVKTTVGYDR